ncbi:MAG: adenylate/guanylate cyclase domain-containing protein [Phormidium sp.]
MGDDRAIGNHQQSLLLAEIERLRQEIVELKQKNLDLEISLSTAIEHGDLIENQLRQTQEKYRSIFENAAEGIFVISPDGEYLDANLALAKMYGYESIVELISTITDIRQQLYVQPQRWDELLAYLKGYDSVTGFESEVYRKDQSKFWISENVRAIYALDGSLLHYEGSVHDIGDRKMAEAELRQQRLLSERLLLNVLPQLIAERLKRGEKTIADSFSEVTVLFADIVSFTPLSSQIPPKELVELLNNIFSTFDSLADQHKVEKIKTIGDAYMVVGGLPKPRVDHLEAIANMALDMQQKISQFFTPDDHPITLRIGIHTGPVIAGVIGRRKSAYDLWGDTVNIASRMESQGEAGYIQVTQTVYDHLKENYLFQERGSILVKGKGLMTTYWLLGRKGKAQ